jgi:hypothetical protein
VGCCHVYCLVPCSEETQFREQMRCVPDKRSKSNNRLNPAFTIPQDHWLISMEWDYVSELLPLTDILFIPQMIWVWRATVELYWRAKAEELGDKPVPVPLCPPQTPDGLTRARTRASAVRGRRLTAWAMVRPEWSYLCILSSNFVKYILSWEGRITLSKSIISQIWRYQRAITLFTRACHRLLTSSTWIQNTSSNPVFVRSILILSLHQRLDLPSGFFPSRFTTNVLYAFLISPMRATCTAHLSLLYLVILLFTDP